MDEISHGPERDFRLPERRWLAVAAAAGLIAAATALVVTGGGSRHASPSLGPPVLRPLTAGVLARIPLPISQSSDIALSGSTAWISDWHAGKVVAVDLAARRVTRTLGVGGPQDGPISLAAGRDRCGRPDLGILRASRLQDRCVPRCASRY